MVGPLVRERSLVVPLGFVRVDRRFPCYVIIDEALQRLLIRGWHYFYSDLVDSAFLRAHQHGVANCPRLVSVSSVRYEMSLIHLDWTGETAASV